MANRGAIVINWGEGWQPVPPNDPVQDELDREVTGAHPLGKAHPQVFGRCTSCDDVVCALDHVAGEPELAVVHLTYNAAADLPPAHRSEWPYSERVTTPEFIRRFLEGGEHL